MKFTLCTFFVSALFLFVTAGQVYAQINPQRALYIEKSEKYRRMKNTGVTLTGLGSVMFVVGVATLINSSTTTTYTSGGGMQTSSTGNVEGGIAAYLIGVGCLGAGIPLWIVGGVNHGRYERKLEQLDVGFNLKPNNVGVRLAYRF